MKTHLNLVPESVQQRRLLRRWGTRWLAIGLAGAAVLAAYIFELDRRIHRDDQIRASLESKARPIVEIQKLSERLKAELVALEQNDALLRRLTGEGSPIESVGLVSVSAERCDGRIWVQRIRFETELPEEKKKSSTIAKTPVASAAPAAQPKHRLTVEGVGVDPLAVPNFVSELRDTKGFQNVELKSSLKTEMQGVSTWTFVIESEL